MKFTVPLAPSPSSDLAWRVLALVNLFRLLTPILLGTLFVTVSSTQIGQVRPPLFAGTATAYFLFAVMSIVSVKRRQPNLGLQTVVGVACDMLAITLLTYSSGGTGSGLAVLMVLPIGAASFIVRPRIALLFAALGTLGLLLQQGFTTLSMVGDLGDFTAVGIVGAATFIIALGMGPLAERLKESEELVRQREVDVANLAELNQFIVQHLRESILVVDANDSIKLINESAAKLLNGGPVQPDTLLGEVSPRLLLQLGRWRSHSNEWQQDSASVLSADGGSMIQPHFVSLEQQGKGPTLIFLEDTTLIAERVQQSKLAALGRLSASIAHEIRNPVGAMSHAAQLLGEAPSLAPQERRLADIIISNGERVSTIIENVLQLSRRDSARPERIGLNAWLMEFLGEFRQTAQVDERTLRFSPAAEDVEVWVDPSHLHQVAWNLCENALKYGRGPGADADIELRTGRASVSDRPYLEIQDRGPGIPPQDVERVFEPFFTSADRSGGTGLGLFIARELAHSNRAVLGYEPRPAGGSIFRLVFADPQRWE